MTPSHSVPSLSPVVLAGRWVRLEPLTLAHVPDLALVAIDDDLWKWTVERVASTADLEAYVQRALDQQKAGVALPFATVARTTGRAIGCTRFGQFEREHSRIEIGWTWIGREWQATAINTEAKLLMLAHAFDTLGLRRVELKTDVLNERSRRAIARLGAVEEGVLRQHVVTRTGRVRDTVYYSILASEWPAVRAGLEAKLATGAKR
ncbi:MAG: GNAT family N-acetyltransferase [Deltaproteobacteria bacterium]|nr:GNAT family N-acetyltransferase [Nannocystaceae bacterium]